MRNRLQYFYSIAVFAGVLATTYFMVDRQQSLFAQRPAPTSVYRSEANLVDPALGQLFQMETDFANLKSEQSETKARGLTRANEKPKTTPKLPVR